MAPITTSNFDSGFLTPEQAGPIFEKAREMSTVQRVARQVQLGPNGTDVTVYTGDVTAGWVGENQTKPTTEAGASLKTIKPQKLATIFVVSAETVRANPANFMNDMRDRVAEAFAKAFDSAALHGTNTPFGTYIDQTTKSVSLVDSDLTDGAATEANTYLQLNAGLDAIVTDDKELTGFLFDPKAEPLLNSAVDNSGRPLFLESTYTSENSLIRPGRLMGRPSYVGKGVAASPVIGYGGDWTQVVWGTVGGISFDVSQEASIDMSAALDGSNIVSLWQNNLVAVRAEAEYGLLVNDPEAFVQYTTETDAP
ncbi:major capsid protein [Actinopolyspora erythraea]|uniref:Major capsid protein n=1 Tax=Actinopolyspora erythraea TaxID=414996 RepID=A0A099D7H9_9ACTN|nr:phage major capsid protein [Actinopolyspora erythraea]ASU78494.1 major capsid protein [Actinopolyspora erythraea]KGI82063.1 hypothetical protein IL38_07025 [Actinopolyspora erythraea]